MDNPVFGSSQFASTTMTKPLRNLKKRNHLDFDSSASKKEFGGGYTTMRPCDKPMLRRRVRISKAEFFRNAYLYGSSMDRKTCIWSGGDGDSWLDKSSGITWVGVHGMDSLCVVSRTGDLDIKRVRGYWKNDTIESFLHHFRKTIISEIEDPSSKSCSYFANPPNKLRHWVDQSIKKPFGIVSVGTHDVHKQSGHEASNYYFEENQRVADLLLKAVQKLRPQSFPAPAKRDEKNTIKSLQEKMETDTTFMNNETLQALEYDEKKAIKCLREKIESGVAFTMDETIQAAISAFQHLFQKKFKANEIGVTVMNPDYDVSEHETKYNDVYAQELEIHDIEKHLAVINEPGSGFK